MKLYHGTAFRHLPKILKHGLKPRGRRKGNWKHTIDSHPDAVYLTVAYPLYYSLCSVEPKEKKGLIFEIDSNKLNPFCLCPDEDFLGHALDIVGMPASLSERSAYFRDRLHIYADGWEFSIAGLGNCCYMGGVPLEAITRYAIIPDIRAWIRWSDPTISPLNFKIMGEYYKALSARLFDHSVQYVDETGFNRFPPDEQFENIKVVEL